mmetsp:Transcript_45244/g.105858  ORF Transcript_45244/g.105858 Transcript_45244/m.105858 type:complete len:214 (+) Transcript_45244:248-889(+)
MVESASSLSQGAAILVSPEVEVYNCPHSLELTAQKALRRADWDTTPEHLGAISRFVIAFAAALGRSQDFFVFRRFGSRAWSFLILPHQNTSPIYGTAIEALNGCFCLIHSAVGTRAHAMRTPVFFSPEIEINNVAIPLERPAQESLVGGIWNTVPEDAGFSETFPTAFARMALVWFYQDGSAIHFSPIQLCNSSACTFGRQECYHTCTNGSAT